MLTHCQYDDAIFKKCITLNAKFYFEAHLPGANYLGKQGTQVFRLQKRQEIKTICFCALRSVYFIKLHKDFLFSLWEMTENIGHSHKVMYFSEKNNLIKI